MGVGGVGAIARIFSTTTLTQVLTLWPVGLIGFCLRSAKLPSILPRLAGDYRTFTLIISGTFL